MHLLEARAQNDAAGETGALDVGDLRTKQERRDPRRLGHSDIRLTLGTYAHVIEAGRDRAAGVMDRVLQTRV
jgi:hypothetical protein